MLASDSRTLLTSLRVSLSPFSSASLEIRSDFEIGLPIRGVLLFDFRRKFGGIVGETARTWKQKAGSPYTCFTAAGAACPSGGRRGPPPDGAWKAVVPRGP